MAVIINEDIEKIKEEVEEVGNILFSSETWIDIGMLGLKVFFIILLSIIVVKIGKSVISRAFKVKLKGALRQSERRETTLIKLLQNTLIICRLFRSNFSDSFCIYNQCCRNSCRGGSIRLGSRIWCPKSCEGYH